MTLEKKMQKLLAESQPNPEEHQQSLRQTVALINYDHVQLMRIESEN